MAYLIGTDEAGYGPNLGPLVIAASVWQVPGTDCDVDLYARLSKLVSPEAPPRKPPRAAQATSAAEWPPIRIGDSKQLYRPGGGLQLLERAVVTGVSAIHDQRPADWRTLLARISPASLAEIQDVAWHSDFNPPIPWQCDSQQLDADLARWSQETKATGIRLVDLRAAMIFPTAFNRDVARLDSKGLLLSNTTLKLVADSLTGLNDEPVRIVCDKHGGRNHYGALLQPHFATGLVRVSRESRQLSQYDVGTKARPIQICFQVGGESFLPSALASMTAKYLRELAMAAFNAFWQQHVGDLRPTAGYPVDALRFRREIERQRQTLRIPLETLWRER